MIVALTIGASLFHANRVRTAMAAAGNSPEGRSTLAGLIHAAVCVVAIDALALGGDRLRALTIIPAHIFSALLTCGVGIYLVGSVRRWFDRELLPKTEMSPGMRASLLTLFANIGYVLVVLQSLSVLGVRWHNLAWIVSALSVGIGFGLQEIAKNFISGLILLAEWPVKVGRHDQYRRHRGGHTAH
ncbi:small-conductance mechanosensitive channel [Paraburkholderia sp. JPY419]